MKKILITGKGSYLGTSLKQYLERLSENYEIEEINMHGQQWRACDFSKYDCVFHTAGIAHVEVGKLTKAQQAEYRRVNTKLAVDTAKKARAEGVPQFIFMSSILVYKTAVRFGKARTISLEEQPAPMTLYGDSKWQAEQELRQLETERFAVGIIRAPMIYGAGSKGNFPVLKKLAVCLPIFPAVRNQRSMLYVKNLCALLKLLIDSGAGGIFLPQNREYVSTSEMVHCISGVYGKHIFMTRLFKPAVWILSWFPGKVGELTRKSFGNLTYTQAASECQLGDYQLYSMEESIWEIYEKELQ